jgi:hypothetical protein
MQDQKAQKSRPAMRKRARSCSTKPLCGGGARSTGPQGNRHGCRFLFVRTGVLSKSPASAHGLGGRSPSSAKWGGLSFGYFSLATQRKVTRPPQEDESPASKLSTTKSHRRLIPIRPGENVRKRDARGKNSQARKIRATANPPPRAPTTQSPPNPPPPTYPPASAKTHPHKARSAAPENPARWPG